eukprot:1179090-Prorocentrum_minimum.AAC.1
MACGLVAEHFNLLSMDSCIAAPMAAAKGLAKGAKHLKGKVLKKKEVFFGERDDEREELFAGSARCQVTFEHQYPHFPEDTAVHEVDDVRVDMAEPTPRGMLYGATTLGDFHTYDNPSFNVATGEAGDGATYENPVYEASPAQQQVRMIKRVVVGESMADRHRGESSSRRAGSRIIRFRGGGGWIPKTGRLFVK